MGEEGGGKGTSRNSRILRRKVLDWKVSFCILKLLDSLGSFVFSCFLLPDLFFCLFDLFFCLSVKHAASTCSFVTPWRWSWSFGLLKGVAVKSLINQVVCLDWVNKHLFLVYHYAKRLLVGKFDIWNFYKDYNSDHFDLNRQYCYLQSNIKLTAKNIKKSNAKIKISR